MSHLPRDSITRAVPCNRKAHSQTTAILHPNASSSEMFRRSRLTFSSNLVDQNVSLELGWVHHRQSRCLCQKQPWTSTTALYFGNTRSGFPGRSGTCVRYRNPAACSAVRIVFSGLVFLPRMPAIICERFTLSTTSATVILVLGDIGEPCRRRKGGPNRR